MTKNMTETEKPITSQSIRADKEQGLPGPARGRPDSEIGARGSKPRVPMWNV